MAFSSVLFISTISETIEYEITSKYVTDVIEGKIGLKDYYVF